MNKLDKISGLIKIKKIEYNNNNFELIDIFAGGICLNINNNNLIITNYISGIVEATFLSYYEIKNNIDWNSGHQIHIYSKSKLWDYLQFSIEQVKNILFNKITFNKINKFSSKEEYYNIYGNVHKKIKINNKIKLNMIHNLLPKSVFYLSKLQNTYNGSLIYKLYNNKLQIFGFTSFNHNNYTKIVPLSHLNYTDTLIELDLEPYKFSKQEIYNIPIINNTFYPKFTTNYSNILLKNDVLIEINNYYINNCCIYNYELDIKQTIDEYLMYHHNSIVLFKIIRSHHNKLIIKDIEINVKKFNKKYTNKIYLDINNLYNKKQIIFNTDIYDNIIKNNHKIYNSDILKYLDEPYYFIKNI